ncbi:MAG: cupin domain-containing protein [Promethearchaeota archaeon]
MQIVKGSEQTEHGGVRYMIRGPEIDWGIISLSPGEEKPAHFHEQLAETFYVINGTMTFIIGDKEFDIPTDTAIRLEAKEPHGLKNKSNSELVKVIFIKEKYIPEDKVNY